MPESQADAPEATGRRWYFTGDVARILGLNAETVVRMADEGNLPVWRASATAQRRFDAEAIDELARTAARPERTAASA